QQEHDAELGERLDARGIVDPAEPTRPDQRSHDEKPRNRGQAHALEGDAAGGRYREDQQQLLEKVGIQNRMRRGRPSSARTGFSTASITACSEVSLNTACPSSCASTVSARAVSLPRSVSTVGRLDGS